MGGRVPDTWAALLQLVVSISCLLLLSRVIEPTWGSKEYIKYLTVVNLGTGTGTLVAVYLAYALDRNNEGNLLCGNLPHPPLPPRTSQAPPPSVAPLMSHRCSPK